jgi:CRP/FNR family transcriptional regulator
MQKSPAALEDIFPHWEKLTEQQQLELKKHTEERRFPKGQKPHQGSVDCAGLFLIKNGQLRVYILSETGKEVTLYRLFAWDICLFSASCIMKNISFELHVEAEKDTDVLIVPAALYERLMKASLPVADYTNQLMSSRFSDVMWIMEQILFTSFDSRLAAFLLEQSAIEQSSVLMITHDEIARHMGSAREVVTKMLNYFASEGMVQLSRGKITLLDEKKLQGLGR